MPRKKKSSEEQKETKKKKAQKKEKFVDAEALLDEYLDEVVLGLGISFLKLKPEEYKEILKEPFVAAVGQVKTKPKSRTIINRLTANKDAMMEYIAMGLVRITDIEKTTCDQFEFIVYNTKKAIVDLAPKLYREAVKRNRKDLIDVLRYNWNLYGIVSPIRCPKCGFNSIMPDLSCKVCEYVMSMKELKAQINVVQALQDYYSVDPEGFKEILTLGYFYYTAEGPISPSKFKPSPQVLAFEVILNKDEKKTLSSIYNNLHSQ
ncbi:hypothetical protein [Acidianus sp. HS-5]|uniref:hypothetical protein n=1 Tax=Acidianus sp. HS-5 TaxID=2886040 RepID=UPI001F3B31E1|nr:hypothetical protein [Acidianus sp. HS-5]BDC19893.1 hypothetical protein HS5_27830 [Acidianus sp. HS-5]